jgi:hypothetical protein
MAPTQSLQKWVQEQYRTVGIDKEGNFIGEDRFTDKLIGCYGSTEDAQTLDQRSDRAHVSSVNIKVAVTVSSTLQLV